MKQITLLIIAWAFALTNCDAQTNPFVKSVNDFSFTLFRQLRNDSNIVLSPLSVELGLLAASAGADGDTRKEFENAFQYKIDSTGLNNISTYLSRINQSTDSNNIISIANSLWINSHFHVKESYTTDIKKYFNADVSGIDVSKPQMASDQINHWVNTQTKGLIPEMTSPAEIDTSTELFILNTIYLKKEWAYPFYKEYTNKHIFYTAQNKKSNQDFMQMTRYCDYVQFKKFKTVFLPYKGNHTSMVIILPNRKKELKRIESQLSSQLIDDLYKMKQSEDVRLSIPKFSSHNTCKLIPSMQKIGIKSAFTQNANFKKIADSRFYINIIKHTVVFEIDEKGTKAAAVTKIGVLVGSIFHKLPKPIEFNANHPFVYMVIDNDTQCILFIGEYNGN